MAKVRKDNKGRNLRPGETQRADGSYMYVYKLGTKKKYLYDSDLASLRVKEKQINKDKDDGIRTQEAMKLTLNDMFKVYMNNNIKLKPSTRANYLYLWDFYVKEEPFANKYTVLDISSLTGDLLTVGMFVALDFVWDRAKADRTEEKAIFIDECWQLLSGAGATGTRLAGDFVLEIFKTIRGFGGSAICASQDLNDFFNLDEGRFGKGIINNSKTKIILNLEDDEAERVQETLHLSDAETMEVTHFERGSGLISTNNNNIMVGFKASPLEKDLITTDRRELRELLERKRQEQADSA